jgi:hypothetical protein
MMANHTADAQQLNVPAANLITFSQVAVPAIPDSFEPQRASRPLNYTAIVQNAAGLMHVEGRLPAETMRRLTCMTFNFALSGFHAADPANMRILVPVDDAAGQTTYELRGLQTEYPALCAFWRRVADGLVDLNAVRNAPTASRLCAAMAPQIHAWLVSNPDSATVIETKLAIAHNYAFIGVQNLVSVDDRDTARAHLLRICAAYRTAAIEAAGPARSVLLRSLRMAKQNGVLTGSVPDYLVNNAAFDQDEAESISGMMAAAAANQAGQAGQ